MILNIWKTTILNKKMKKFYWDMKYEKLGREVLLFFINQERLHHIKTQYIVNEETINLYIVVFYIYIS